MAYVAMSPDDEEEQKKATNPLLAGFGASTGATGGGAAAAPAGPQQPSSNFIPYSAYLSANQGGAQKMAGAVAKDVDASAAGVQKDTSAATTDFKNQVNAGNPFYQPPQAGASAALSMWGGGVPNQVAPPVDPQKTFQANPYQQPTLSPEETKKKADAKYTGPTATTGLESWKGLGERTKTAQMELDQTKTDVGRQALAQKKYGTTGGSSRLDAALMGSADGGQFEALRQKYGDLTKNYDAAAKSADALAYDTNQTVADGAQRAAGTVKEQLWAAAHPTSADPLNKPYQTPQEEWLAAHPADRTKTFFEDPTKPFGYRDMMDQKSGAFAGKDWRGSQDAFRTAFGEDVRTASAVYDSMTWAEYDDLEKMGAKQRAEWLQGRARDMGLGG